MSDIYWGRIKLFFNTFAFSKRNSTIKRFGVPILLVAGILLIKFFLQETFSNVTSFHLLTLTVLLSALYGGFWPGIFATFLAGILNDYFFLQPKFSFLSADSLAITFIFLLNGFIVSTISEALKQSDKQKDEFIGFASHEIKNPLAVIKTYASLLRKKAERGKDTDVLHIGTRIEDQTIKASQLIDDLLNVTKIRAGKIIYRDGKFDIYDLVQEIVQSQKELTNTHEIALIGKSKKKMHGDKYRIEQVIINLITNAVKYSPNANKVVVGLKDSEKNVLITVQDFGIGLSKENQKRVFDPFYRTKKAETGAEGLGLGLYIASEIVKRHGGKLWLESEEGKGSIFFLELPANN